MISAKVLIFSLVIFTSAFGVSCNTCSNPISSTDDTDSTSGECLLQNQNQLHKSTVKTEEMEEDAVQQTEEEAEADESALEDQEEEAEDLDADQDPGVPKCAAAADCKPREGGPAKLDCVGGLCIDASSLKYKWTLATVDKKCPGKSIDALDKGKPEILTCKKKCEKIPGCTGFNRGKKGAIESRCWFFSTCTKDTPKGKLASSPMHNVYFVAANADVEIAKTTVETKKVQVLGFTQTTPDTTEEEQVADQVDTEQPDESNVDQDIISLAQTEEEEEAQTDEEVEDADAEDANQDPDLPKCTAKGDCKGEGQDCVGGICIKAATLKYKWTLATVDKKCPGKSVGALDKGKPEIMTCKKKCEKIPGCTGFNRGKKGAIQSQCWFFSTCTKKTPKGQLASSPMHNVYFVSAEAMVDITKTTYEKKNMKVLGLGQQQEQADTEAEAEADLDQEPEVPKCTAKGDCKGEGKDCVGGICINAATLKYKWTLATVDMKCPGRSIGALDKGKPEILACKKKCESMPGCTGFNRGKKGAIQSRCWFFDSCTKGTPKGKLASSQMHNVYFVSAEAEVDIVTVTKKKMNVLG